MKNKDKNLKRDDIITLISPVTGIEYDYNGNVIENNQKSIPPIKI